MKCFKKISNTFQDKFFKEQLGKEDISTIGDGTILGAIKYLSSNGNNSINNSELEEIKKSISGITTKIGTSDIQKYGTNITNAISSLGDKVSKIESSPSSGSSIFTCDTLWQNDTIDNHNFYASSHHLNYNAYNYNFISVYYKDFFLNNTEKSYITGLYPFCSFTIDTLVLTSTIEVLKSRPFSIDDNGDYITFLDCTGNTTYNNSINMANYNSYCVPIAVYGYK